MFAEEEEERRKKGRRKEGRRKQGRRKEAGKYIVENIFRKIDKIYYLEIL